MPFWYQHGRLPTTPLCRWLVGSLSTTPCTSQSHSVFEKQKGNDEQESTHKHKHKDLSTKERVPNPAMPWTRTNPLLLLFTSPTKYKKENSFVSTTSSLIRTKRVDTRPLHCILHWMRKKEQSTIHFSFSLSIGVVLSAFQFQFGRTDHVSTHSFVRKRGKDSP